MGTRNYPPGKNDVLMYCYFRYDNRDTLFMTVEIRPNKQHEWISVQYMNRTGSYRTEEYYGREPYPFLSVTIDKTDYCRKGLVCVTYLEASVQLDSCIIDPDRFPTYRCRAFNGRYYNVSPEMNIVESIEGNITCICNHRINMQYVLIMYPRCKRNDTKCVHVYFPSEYVYIICCMYNLS